MFLHTREMFISTSDVSSNMIGERLQQAMEKSDDDIIGDIKMGKAAFFGNIHLLSAMKARADGRKQGKYKNITVHNMAMRNASSKSYIYFNSYLKLIFFLV